METLSSIFRMSYWKRFLGERGQPSTLTSSVTASSSGKLPKSSQQTLLNKLHELAMENHRLKEEVRLLKQQLDPEYDV
jgi:hypothetical protein